jgi:SAM-dependent methyltransferase
MLARMTTTSTTTAESDELVAERRDTLVNRLNAAVLAMDDLLTVYIGDRLGLYAALASGGPLTSTQLAASRGIVERYAREWLEQQAVTGLLEVDDCEQPGAMRRYSLPAGHAEVLLDRTSLSYMAPIARLMVSLTRPLPALLEAFRTGGGVPWSAFGADAREGQSDGYRPVYHNLLGREWLPQIARVDARLHAEPAARVADIGCGAGWGSLAIAEAYPGVRVDGFDIDPPSVEMARGNARVAGLGERVQFHVRDAGEPGLANRYDLVCVFEALHDMSHPVDALRTMRGMLAPGGSVLVVDEKVADRFTAPGDDLERMMYGFSVLCCLPVGMAEPESAATGTVMRASTLREYAERAGFSSVEVLPIQHDFFRLYLLSDRND